MNLEEKVFVCVHVQWLVHSAILKTLPPTTCSESGKNASPKATSFTGKSLHTHILLTLTPGINLVINEKNVFYFPTNKKVSYISMHSEFISSF